MKPKTNNTHFCTICDKPYRKQDFVVCPHCGGDGGGTTPKTWKPNKHQKIEYINKLKLN